MDNKKQEQVVYLKDLLFAVLYCWRALVIFAVITALLLGGFGGLRSYKAYRAAAVSSSNESLKAAYEKAQSAYTDYEAYMEQSILNQLDPNNLAKASATLILIVDKPAQADETTSTIDNTATLVWAYLSAFSSGKAAAELSQQLGIDERCTRELMGWQQLPNSNAIMISANHHTPEQAQQILDLMLNQLYALTPQLRATAGNHQLQLVDSCATMQKDPVVAEAQLANQTKLTELSSALDNARAAYNNTVRTPMSKANVIKTSVIWAVIGGIVGAFLIAGWAVLRHLSKGTVYSCRTLRNCTGIKLLGAFCLNKHCALDRWLMKLEGRSYDPEHINIVVANVRNYAAGCQCLLVTGDSDAAATALADALKQAGVPAQAPGSLLRSAEALELLPKCDAVLLVETCHVSRYSHVRQLAERVADQNKPLLGCVLANG